MPARRKASSPANSSPLKTTKATPEKPTSKKHTADPADESDQPAKKSGRGRPSKASKAAEAKEKAEREQKKKQVSLEASLATNGDAEGSEMDGLTKQEADGELEGETKANKNVDDVKNEDVKGEDEHEETKETAEAAENGEKKEDTESAETTSKDNSKIEDAPRKAAIPPSILEKGVIYFFFRPRVNINEPQGIEDIARSHIVLRPIDTNAKLNETTLEVAKKARLLVLPKKQLPKSKKDRFLVFVEKKGEKIESFKEFFASNDYATKTAGTSHSPAATPFAEGVYAITSAAGASHLAYNITVPKEIGEVQKELGINEKGSFVVSVKNPEIPGPANAAIKDTAKYPAELQNKFRGLRWIPLIPELLEYEGTQVLIIGEGFGNLGNAGKESEKDKNDESTETPAEELEKLEEEDHDRVEGLEESDPVFADLALSHNDYKDLQTTW